MVGEIINVGTEILLGDILNTNAQFLSKELASLGVSVYFQSVVGDNEERLLSLLNTAKSRSDLIILSGGLGPTVDDMTKEAVAKFLGLPLYEDNYIKEKLVNFFKSHQLNMTQNNLKQALIPEGGTILDNKHGTAPGILIEKDQKVYFVLPGPPKELMPMFNEYVVPYIKSKSNDVIVSKTLRVVGIGESSAEEAIKDIIQAQSNPTIAPYAKSSEVHFRITAKAKTEADAIRLIDEFKPSVYERLGDNIYTEEDKNLNQVVVEQLIQSNLSIATAESCTGGLIASGIVDSSGASKIFHEGFITYSNEAKIKLINVEASILSTYGAVSEETAKAMALGVKNKTGSRIGISATGIAGPTGGTTEKPVGLVYIGIAYDDDLYVKKLQLSGNRDKIRETTAKRAMIFLREILNEKRV
jgi:nicotinamide-nucleotide amidase